MFKRFLTLSCALVFSLTAAAQLYFPPNGSGQWQTTDPSELGWCQDSIDKLYDYLDATNTDAFILLKNGRIVLERYFGAFTQFTPHAWNSAGKTLTGFAVGMAQEDGFLSISDTTSDYLGTGWTSLTPDKEQKITIRHQLTMTSGMNDMVNAACTDPECLTYVADAGTRWAYHNAPYTLLDSVMHVATGSTLNEFIDANIEPVTGITGQFIHVDYNHVYFSNARSMARFGLLLLAEGIWNGVPVLGDAEYFHDMTHSSQSLNESYGYLTWLNGQSSYMIPQTQIVFPGSPMPAAPDDMFAALGKESQLLNVSPGAGLVLVRMGQEGTENLVSTFYNDTIWQYVNRLQCTLGVDDEAFAGVSAYPNPSNGGNITISGLLESDALTISEPNGKAVDYSRSEGTIMLSNAAAGLYFLRVSRAGHNRTLKLLIK
jgi:CubicO group peptidase (beta-lactamase class C family)